MHRRERRAPTAAPARRGGNRGAADILDVCKKKEPPCGGSRLAPFSSSGGCPFRGLPPPPWPWFMSTRARERKTENYLSRLSAKIPTEAGAPLPTVGLQKTRWTRAVFLEPLRQCSQRKTQSSWETPGPICCAVGTRLSCRFRAVRSGRVRTRRRVRTVTNRERRAPAAPPGHTLRSPSHPRLRPPPHPNAANCSLSFEL